MSAEEPKIMATKRKIEVFSAGCPACEEAIALVNRIACPSCEVEVLDMHDRTVAKRAKRYGVKHVPAVVVKGQFLRFAELLYADCHFVMSGFRLRAIGTEESVPPRKIESEIAVRLAPQDRVMNAVHIGRHDEPTQDALDSRRHPHVAVVEHGSGVQGNFKEQHGQRGGAERGDESELDAEGKKDLDGVKSSAGGHVDVKVGMVHPMKTPEGRHVVKDAVLKVNG